MIKVGPAGGLGKTWDDEGREKIVQIFVSHGDQINSLQFLYVEDGNLVLSETHGGNTGPKFNVVKLNYPSEYLTGISGSYYYSNTCSQWLIFTVAFSTNNRTYGPFGVPHKQGYAFEYQLGEDHPFGGFHGRASEYLNAIGVYVKPITILGDVKANVKTKKFKCPLLRSN
ncbi:inactive protein RESTRICTED TEV MOVEMENT 1-like [Rhododendron vialii]|uniref:inactive protein RESTRICTED TEV MOVEMENT 1-like n=1 Tax=Rhododendron vialii TaxID=182163 RepID=UPI00265DBA9B|nr:inactive protein RESTRICTED TEV MOVEMENT 1-like [Rhododendron vialii]